MRKRVGSDGGSRKFKISTIEPSKNHRLEEFVCGRMLVFWCIQTCYSYTSICVRVLLAQQRCHARGRDTVVKPEKVGEKKADTRLCFTFSSAFASQRSISHPSSRVSVCFSCTPSSGLSINKKKPPPPCPAAVVTNRLKL